jgi:hypothetical protein
MSNVVQSAFRAASREMIAKLIKAGYLQPARRNADAITRAIVRDETRPEGPWGNDDGPNAA